MINGTSGDSLWFEQDDGAFALTGVRGGRRRIGGALRTTRFKSLFRRRAMWKLEDPCESEYSVTEMGGVVGGDELDELELGLELE